MSVGGVGNREKSAFALKLFGFEIDVQWSFVANALLPLAAGRTIAGAIQWLLLALVSVGAHELGHAMVARRFGAEPKITLAWLGGNTRMNARVMTRSQELAMTAAGPLASFAFGALALAAHFVVPATRSELTHSIIEDAVFMGFGWGVLNLVPTLPLDGAQIVRSLLGRRAADELTPFDVAASTLALVASTLMLSQIKWLEKRTLYSAAAGALVYHGLLGFHVFQVRADAAHERTFDEISARLESEDFDAAARKGEELLPKLRSRNARWRAIRLVAKAHHSAKRFDRAAAVIDMLPRGSSIEEHVTVDCFVHTEQFARAVAFARERLAANPNPYSRRLLLFALARAGSLDEALAIDLTQIDDAGTHAAAALKNALFQAKRYTDLISWLPRVLDRFGQAADAYDMACVHALRGQHELASQWLHTAVDRGYWNRAHLEADDDLRDVRARPEVQALIERMPTAPPVAVSPLTIKATAAAPRVAVAYARVTK